jgi:hypothetical protein
MQPYTLVITSAGRPHLLKQTWAAFTATCGQGPRETIVIDDGDLERPDWLPRHNVTWLNNGTRKGQIYSVDRAYERVKTPYIFHCEDDWGFHDGGYMEQSFEILEKYPDVLQVWLRGIPTAADIRDRFQIHVCEPHPIYPFSTAQYRWADWKGGFSFNPGLRRKADHLRIGSYGRHVGYDPQGCGERALGLLYHELGFISAILPWPYVYHIGDESHVDRKLNQPAPRILVAIPTAEEMDYTDFREAQKVRYPHLTWGPGGFSGLQKDGPNPRKQAVLDTWWRDLAAHSNVVGKMFTGKELGCSDKFVDLPEKNRLMCQYGLDNGFDYIFRCDDDSFVYVDRMVRLTLEYAPEYAGSDCGGFAIGGAGIWLNRHAMGIVNGENPPAAEWRDDAFIGSALSAHGIKMFAMPGTAGENQLLGPAVTEHPVSPEKMRELYNALTPCPVTVPPAH